MDIRVKKIIDPDEKQRMINWIKKNESYENYSIKAGTHIYAIVGREGDNVEILGVFELSNIPFIRIALNKDKNAHITYKSYEKIRTVMDGFDIHPLMLLDEDNILKEYADEKLTKDNSKVYMF